ncbi:MAG: hypothetical protein ACREVE_03505 [Gammaproteobacteria bacterium]
MCQTPEEAKLFDQIVAKIYLKHDQLGHVLGCSFLYTSRKTFTGGARIVFLGINPGGAKRESNVESVELGNAHYSELWDDGVRLSKLQLQVCRLYKIVARKLYPNDSSLPNRLMDEAIQSNFIPFRSHKSETLHEPKKSRSFACELWKEIFSNLFAKTAPRVIVWHGVEEFDRYSKQILPGFSFNKAPTGWKRRPYRYGIWQHNGQQVYVLGLPQLSRYTIISNPKCVAAVDTFTDQIANALR